MVVVAGGWLHCWELEAWEVAFVCVCGVCGGGGVCVCGGGGGGGGYWDLGCGWLMANV